MSHLLLLNLLIIFCLGIVASIINLFLFNTFLPRLNYQNSVRKATKLAQNAENYAKELNHLDPDFSPKAPNDIVSILQSTCLLLERLLQTPSIYKPAQIEPPSKPEIASEPQLSVIAKELIKLRDWVLLAQSGGNTIDPKVLQEIYRQLGKALEKEKVISLEETGKVDYEHQQVVDTQMTNDPTKNNCVYTTVRPGYLFHNWLVRPQEVIIYTSNTTP